MAIMQNNDVLASVEQAIMEKAKNKPVVNRIVAAGMKIMFDARTHDLMLQQINQPGDIIENVGRGVADMMSIMYRQSRGTMPIDAGIPAAVILLCHALDFLNKAGKIKVDNTVVANATQAMMAYVMQKMGINPANIEQMRGRVQAANPEMKGA